MTSRQLSEAELKKLRKGNEVVITSEYSVLRRAFLRLQSGLALLLGRWYSLVLHSMCRRFGSV